MTKDEIMFNNEQVLIALNDFWNTWDSLPNHGRFFKFRNCNARTISARIDDDSDITFLVSYDTEVACVYRNKAKKVCICLDYLRYAYKYTSTSSQHISKFFHDFVDGYASRYNCRVVKRRFESVKVV